MNEELYANCKNQGLHPSHVAEVGVFFPETSNVLGFIREGIRATLVEPDPLCLNKMYEFFSPYNSVRIYPYAIFDKPCRLSLYRTNASTFVSGLSASPALVNDNYKPREEDRFSVQAVTFGEIDDGSIEVISIDTEGCEWYVLQTMKSRPMVISLETHAKKYTNPFINEINRWISENGYKVWYKTSSDTVFVKNSMNVLPVETRTNKKSFLGKLSGLFRS